MRAGSLSIVVLWASLLPGMAHDRETTSVTWNQTVSRIVEAKCTSCHRSDGSAFSLTTYDEARPWAVAIRDEILARTMPPWGAVSGFGDFRNDHALSPAQTNLIVSWVEGGVPEGPEVEEPETTEASGDGDDEEPTASLDGARILSGPYTVREAFTLDGIWPQEVVDRTSFKIMAELPSGRVEPLLWLYEYRDEFGHPFLLRQPLDLPAGTRILGVPDDAEVALIPAH